MRWSGENIRKRLIRMPMMAVVVPLVIGIAFAERLAVPTALWCAGIAACMIAAAVWRTWAGVWLCAAMFPLGAMLCNEDMPPAVEYDVHQHIGLRFDGATVRGEKYNTSSAEIVEYGGTIPSKTIRAVVRSDTTMHFTKGDRISLNGCLRRFNDKYPAYGRLMYHRGYVGTLWLSANATFDYRPAERRGLHERAVGKLASLLPQGSARSTVLSMAVGERTQMNAELRRAYARSGSSHLLAVSGLHVGIVFLLVNALLVFMPLVHNGNLWRCATAACAIWLYTAMCGMPPSAVRAAVMFTALQAGISFSREYTGINILAGAAFAMLVCAPRMLFDIGFQLSFVAVLGIMFWGMPLCRCLRTHRKAIDIPTDMLVVGLVATVATLPLVSHTFGLVSVAGILLNPVVILLANAIVLSAITALLLPASVAVFVAKPALWCAEVQNRIVCFAADLPYGCFDYRCTTVATVVVYTLFVAVTVASWGFERNKTVRVGDDN